MEVLGEAEIAEGRYDAAAERGRELADLGAALACKVILARGERLQGRALARSREPATARTHLEAALSTFTQLGMSFEAARTRHALSEALREVAPEVAEAEARAALDSFERLGAESDADAAAALLRVLGVKAARSGPRGRLGALTKREREVLSLLGEGLSNPEIAERLFLSRKTVEHHVAHVLRKLNVKNRAEAAAEAVRRLGQESAAK
jgi:DNA-binding NarL/FixJ family response regulator